MDGAFLPFLIGGLVTLGGTYLANYFTLRREREQWERQQRVEREKLGREERERAREQLREIYSNCIRGLSTYLDAPSYPDEDDYDMTTSEGRKQYQQDWEARAEIRNKYYVEAQHWLWLLSINLEDVEEDELSKFNEELRLFIEDRGVNELREIILSLARNDSRLSVNSADAAKLPPANADRKVRELSNA